MKTTETLLDMAETMPIVNIYLTEGYKEVLNDIQQGRVYHADNAEDMFRQILGYVPN